MAKVTKQYKDVIWTLELTDQEAKGLRGLLGGISGSVVEEASGYCNPEFKEYTTFSLLQRIRIALDKAGI